MKRGVAGALLLLAAALIPWRAQAVFEQTPGSGIEVANCDPHMHQPGGQHAWVDPYGVWHSADVFPLTEGFLAIAYTNRARQAATEVEFGLVARGSLVALAKDVGTFSPGVKIEHEFVISPEVFPLGTALPECMVMWVRYADGSIWQNPNPPPR